MKTIHLFKTNDVERPTTIKGRLSFRWTSAYAEVTHKGYTVPALTRNEWYRQAQRDETLLKFHESQQKAREALIKLYPLINCVDPIPTESK